MNIHYCLLFIIVTFSPISQAQLFNEWIKVGPESRPRYFLKNNPVALCGMNENVFAINVSNPNDKIIIQSCLMVKQESNLKISLKPYKVY